MKELLREPLVQFLLLGTLLFALFEFIGQYNLEKRREIVVTPEQIDTLNRGFQIDFSRPPTASDTEKLIQDYIREEVLVQEAIKAGYPSTDQNIRIELRHRMEDAHSLIPVPTDEDLEQFLKQNPDRFRIAPDKPVPPLSEVKPTVQSVWNATKRKEVSDAAFQRYLQNYVVRVQLTKGLHNRTGDGSVIQMTRRPLKLMAFILLLTPLGAMAHELQLGYLEVRQTGDETFNILWKLPARENLRGIHPKLPDECTFTSEPRRQQTTDSFIEQSAIQCPGGLDGKTISIDPQQAILVDVLVRIVRPDESTQVYRLTPVSTSFIVKRSPTWVDRSWTYLSQGVDHILMGVDHLLFVLGLLLIVKDRWTLAKTITAFTIAHSITLGLATVGMATVPRPPLDAAIALSILFLAPEVLRKERGETSFTIRHPWVVAFAFGLLHGFGFASGLANLGLSRAEIPLALLMFNVGVEIGQLFFVLVIVMLEHAFRRLEIRWTRWAAAIPVYAVGGLGAFWTIQRTLVLIGLA